MSNEDQGAPRASNLTEYEIAALARLRRMESMLHRLCLHLGMDGSTGARIGEARTMDPEATDVSVLAAHLGLNVATGERLGGSSIVGSQRR
jgi:hypothetical protein